MRRISWALALYLVVGAVVAAERYPVLGVLKGLGKILLAIIAWPLLLIGVDININL